MTLAGGRAQVERGPGGQGDVADRRQQGDVVELAAPPILRLDGAHGILDEVSHDRPVHRSVPAAAAVDPTADGPRKPKWHVDGGHRGLEPCGDEVSGNRCGEFGPCVDLVERGGQAVERRRSIGDSVQISGQSRRRRSATAMPSASVSSSPWASRAAIGSRSDSMRAKVGTASFNASTAAASSWTSWPSSWNQAVAAGASPAIVASGRKASTSAAVTCVSGSLTVPLP